MNATSRSTINPSLQKNQRGLVLFFALIALLVLSLAAAALIRSVDTSTIIAGNLAFKQSALSSGDSGVEAAMTWLSNTQAANNTINVLDNPIHAFNIDSPANGYYSSVHDEASDPAFLDLFDNANWTSGRSIQVGTDAAGNTASYIIQRMCRRANQPVNAAGCLSSGAAIDREGKQVKQYAEACPGCPPPPQPPIFRITSRVTGPKNTVSYVQAFVY